VSGRQPTYFEKLKDPRWQKVRLSVLQRDSWTCQHCGDTESELHVHHGVYKFGVEPWDYPLQYLRTYCKPCHERANESRLFTQCAHAALRLDSQMAAFEIMQAVLFCNDEQRVEILAAARDFVRVRVRELLVPQQTGE